MEENLIPPTIEMLDELEEISGKVELFILRFSVKNNAILDSLVTKVFKDHPLAQENMKPIFSVSMSQSYFDEEKTLILMYNLLDGDQQGSFELEIPYEFLTNLDDWAKQYSKEIDEEYAELRQQLKETSVNLKLNGKGRVEVYETS